MTFSGHVMNGSSHNNTNDVCILVQHTHIILSIEVNIDYVFMHYIHENELYES